MPRLIANLPDNARVEFDFGTFDDWCVYLCRPNQLRYAPRDTEYFSELQKLGNIYGKEEIYKHFIDIYTLTTTEVNTSVITSIFRFAHLHADHQVELFTWFTVIYAGMIAEENKQHAILKKRIKRLGVHQVLIDNLAPGYAANFSKGKKWKELDTLCTEKGF